MKQKGLALLLAASLAFSAAACSSAGNETPAQTTEAPTTEAPETQAEQPTTQAAPEGAYTAGTYTATATGMKGEMTVEVTFDADAITDIAVKEHQETYGIGWGLKTAPVEALPPVMLEKFP